MSYPINGTQKFCRFTEFAANKKNCKPTETARSVEPNTCVTNTCVVLGTHVSCYEHMCRVTNTCVVFGTHVSF